MKTRLLSHITAQALVPEQILSYVAAAGGSAPGLYADCVGHEREGHLVLIAYKPGLEPESGEQAQNTLNRAVEAALDASPSTLTVLGPARPEAAPPGAAERSDAYWAIPLPLPKPGQKLRNMLRRALRECSIQKERWTGEHAALVERYLASRPLEAGTRHIYRRIPEYLAATPDALLLAARSTADSRLSAFCIGDFSGLSTGMYMFAFRAQNCPPGAADALLAALARAGADRGHQRLNLGLGINGGIEFFKRKWGASLFLPCVQTTWQPAALDAAFSSGRARRGEQNARARAHNGVREAAPPGEVQESGPCEDNTPLSPDPLLDIQAPGLRESLLNLFLGSGDEFECIQVEVTSFCPGRCGYCPHTTKSDVWRSRHMTAETFAALAPLLRRTKRVHLQGWGEPLLHPRFLDFAAAARRAGCAVSFTTYGLAMTDTLAARLVQSGIDIIAFSLAGTDEASNASREGVPLAKVREAVARLNRARKITGAATPQVHLAYLMLASAVDAVKTLPELMREMEIPVAVVSTLDYVPEAGAEKEAFAPGETDKIERARLILQETAARAGALGLTLHYSLPGPAGANDCGEHIQNCMYIDAEGRISPCIYVNLPTNENDPCRRVFGTVTQTAPLAIWNSPDFKAFRRRLADGDPDLPCRSCAKRFERIF